MADSERDIPDLTTRLTDAITAFAQSPDTWEKTRVRINRLQGFIDRDGPTAYTVSRVASYTRDAVADFLAMTANDWNWTIPQPEYGHASNTLQANHIFDTASVLLLDKDAQLLRDLRKIEIKERLVTEATKEDAFTEGEVLTPSIRRWATIVQTTEIASMRRVEAIRLDLHDQNERRLRRGYEPMRYLADAESINFSLVCAERGVPARLVTANEQSSTWHKRFGLPSTSIWGLFAEAVQAAEAAKSKTFAGSAIGRLRWLREKHDPTFHPDTSSWPRKPPTFPKPPGGGQVKPS